MNRPCREHDFGGLVDWRVDAVGVVAYLTEATRRTAEAMKRVRRMNLRDRFGKDDPRSHLAGYVGHLFAAEKLGLSLSDQDRPGDGGADFSDGSGCKTAAYPGAWQDPRLRVKLGEIRIATFDGQMLRASDFREGPYLRVMVSSIAGLAKAFFPARYHLIALDRSDPEKPGTWRVAYVGTMKTAALVICRVTDPGGRGAPCFEADESIVARRAPANECGKCGLRKLLGDAEKKGPSPWVSD